MLVEKIKRLLWFKATYQPLMPIQKILVTIFHWILFDKPYFEPSVEIKTLEGLKKVGGRVVIWNRIRTRSLMRRCTPRCGGSNPPIQESRDNAEHAEWKPFPQSSDSSRTRSIWVLQEIKE